MDFNTLIDSISSLPELDKWYSNKEDVPLNTWVREDQSISVTESAYLLTKDLVTTNAAFSTIICDSRRERHYYYSISITDNQETIIYRG